MASGQTRIVSAIVPKKSAVPGKIPTGTTLGEIFSNLNDKKLWGYDGSNMFEYGSRSFLGLTGGTITGNTYVAGGLSSTTLSAGTIYSGSTDLYDIFESSASNFIQNKIIVGKSGNVDFTSIKDAIDSITGNSITNRYVIEVNPGKYVEDTIYMKPYVELWGYANFATIIEVDSPAKNVVVLTGSTSINNFILQGSSNSGQTALYVPSSFGIGIVCEVNNCTFGATHTIFKSNLSSGQFAIVGMNNTNCTYFTTFSVGFDISGSGHTTVSFSNSKNTVQCAIEDFVRVSGSLNRMILTDVGVLVSPLMGGSMENFIHAYNGASADCSNSGIDGADTAIYSQNIGSGATIRCSSMNIINSNYRDIDIENVGTTGFFEGTSTFQKVSIVSGSTFFLFGKDKNIITVAKEGGEFNSVKSALDFITGSSEDNRYMVSVGPGVFIENEITVPSYVSIVGSSIQPTIIQPAGNHNVFKISNPNIELSFFGIYNAPTGFAGILLDNCGDFVQTHKLTFQDCDSGIIVSANTQDSFFYGEYIDFNGIYSYGVKVISENGFESFANLENYYNFPTGTATTVGTYVIGSGATVDVLSCGNIGNGFGTAFYIDDGGTLGILSTTIDDYDIGIHMNDNGTAPMTDATGIIIRNSGTYDFKVHHVGSIATIQGAVDKDKLFLNPSARVSLAIQDPNAGDFTISGRLNLRFSSNTITDISTAIVESSTMGVMEGGDLSPGTGFTVNISEGFGYLEEFPDNDAMKKVVWGDTSIVLTANTENYIFFNYNEILNYSSARPDTFFNILLGRVVTNAIGIEFIDKSPLQAEHTGNRLSVFSRDALGPVYVSGSMVTKNTGSTFTLDVTQGNYYFAENNFLPTGGTGVTLKTYYRNGSGGFVKSSTTIVDNNYYDDGTGVLAPLSADYYTKHTLYQIDNNYLFVYGNAQYSAVTIVEQADISTPPTYFSDAVVLIAGIIVKQGATGITTIQDLRPVIGFKAPGVAASSFHGNLLGLGNDDHQQYLLASGSRAMTGDLNLGGNDIISAATVNGVIVETHASRHLPNGADPLTTAIAFTVSTTNQEGVANSFSRSDHRHAHGSQTGGTNHSVVDSTNAGFMSSVDKIYFDTIPNLFNTKANLSGATFTGTVNAPVVSATTLSASTIYSAGTDLYNIFLTTNDGNDITRIQPGTNTYTGGTNNFPTVNVSALTIDFLIVSSTTQLSTTTTTSLSGGTVSGGTLFSGSTNLNLIFQPAGANSVIGNGTNTYTGGTFYNQTINVSALTINTLIVSGSSQLAVTTATSLSGATVSGGTLFSGSTNLNSIFHPLGAVSSVAGGTNTYTGGTFLSPTVNVSALTINTLVASGSSQLAVATVTSLSGGTVSGGTIFSGSTNLASIFQSLGANSVVVGGTNTYTGGTFFNQTVNVSALTINTLVASGATQLAVVTSTSLSGGTVSGGTIFSGATNLNSIFHPLGAVSVNSNGINTYTGGTFFNQTINVSALTINTLIASGSSQLAATTATSLSAGTLSGGTIYSGNTDLYGIFHKKEGYLLQKAGSVTGSTFAGNPKTAAVTFTTPFASASGYSVVITAEVNRTWTIESKTASGFTINANANGAFTSSNVFWLAVEIGEGFR